MFTNLYYVKFWDNNSTYILFFLIFKPQIIVNKTNYLKKLLNRIIKLLDRRFSKTLVLRNLGFKIIDLS